MQITGHKTMSMFERYNTVNRNDARKAFKMLDKSLSKTFDEQITSSLLQDKKSLPL